MLYSMTGYGRAEGSLSAGRQVSVEIKSLNGKQLDLNMRVSPLLRAYEHELRQLLASQLLRGSVDISVVIRQDGSSKPMVVNTELAIYYYESMKQIAQRLSLGEEQILPTLMRMPEVVAPEADVLPEEQWLEVKVLAAAAARQLMTHRREEGASLRDELLLRINNIEGALEKIAPLEPERMLRIRQRIQQSFADAGISADPNRFEQELIYYLEKIDFTEEKTRLTQHCRYFRDAMAKNETAKGKLLGFMLQEVGREINTLGSKANDAAIQQIIVGMKDELEKAKEQALNVL